MDILIYTKSNLSVCFYAVYNFHQRTKQGIKKTPKTVMVSGFLNTLRNKNLSLWVFGVPFTLVPYRLKSFILWGFVLPKLNIVAKSVCCFIKFCTKFAPRFLHQRMLFCHFQYIVNCFDYRLFLKWHFNIKSKRYIIDSGESFLL